MDGRGELSAFLDDEVVRSGFPGAVAGVLVDGEIITAASGITNVEHPLPVDDGTLFQVGSITKTLTSTAVMLLVDEGRLALEDPVAKHLPELSDVTGLDTAAMTIEHLLSHQAGFDGDRLFTMRADSFAVLANARRLFPPGGGSSYNNAAFSIAGEVIERISGVTYPRFVRERLLEPLGMTAACFSADEAITHRVAAPHLALGDLRIVLRNVGWQPGWELGRLDLAAGGLVASVTDLLEWCRFQIDGTTRDGVRLVDRTSLDRLHEPVVRADDTFDFALDWFVRTTSDGATTIEHPGETIGYSSTLVAVPDRGVGVVVLTNAVGGGGLNERIRRWALEHFAGIVERDPRSASSVEVDIDAYTARFFHAFDDLVVTRGPQPGTITVSGEHRGDTPWPPLAVHQPTTFRFIAEDHAVSVDPDGPTIVVRFSIGDGGRAEWLTYDYRRCPRVA